MASATGVDSSDDHRQHHLRLDSLPLVDLRLLSQSDLFSLSLCSSSSSTQSHGRCDDDVLIPKIDRSVFNESAGSRKQTYSRLRLAPRNSQFASSSSAASAARQTPEPLAQERFQVISLLKQLFASGTHDGLVPIRVEYNDSIPEPSSSAVPIHVVLQNSAPEKRKRGRPRKNAGQSLGTFNCGNPLPVSSGPVSFGSVRVGDVVPTPVLSNSAFSVDAKKRKRGRPRKNPFPEIENERKEVLTGMVPSPISFDAAFHHSAMVPSNAVSYGSTRDVVPIPVSFNSAFSYNGKKPEAGPPRKNQVTVLCCNATGAVPIPVSSNAVSKDSKVETVSVPALSNAISDNSKMETVSLPISSNVVFYNSVLDIASSGTQGKRKRGRPRKSENRSVPVVKGEDKVITACDYEKERVEKKEELVNINRSADVVDLVAIGNLEDPFGMELRRRTGGLKTEAELLGFLGGLEGEWGSWRRKKKIVPASELGDTLPRGWKIQISLKRREGHIWLICRRYLSPNGQQFVSCKEAFSYLMASSGVQDVGQSKPGLADGNVEVANKVGSRDDAGLSFEDGKITDVPESISRAPIMSVSTDHGKQSMISEIRDLEEGRIRTDEEKPSSLEANEAENCGFLHGKLPSDALAEACTDRRRADAATCIDRESGTLVSVSHAEKVNSGGNDEKDQDFCEKQGQVCQTTNKNELEKFDEATKVDETTSSNKNRNSCEFFDGTSVVKCLSVGSSAEEPKINDDPGTSLLASSCKEKICSTADRQFTRTVEDRTDESTSSHCGPRNEEECGPAKDAKGSLTSIMMGSACDKHSELGICSSSIDERTSPVSNDVNIASSSTLYESKFPNEKVTSSGSNLVTSDAEAVTSTEHDRSSGRCLPAPPSNGQSFLTVINSDISNFKMEEAWEDRGFESNIFTSFDNDDDVNKSSLIAVDMRKVDARNCSDSSELSDAFGGKDTGIYANIVSGMEQVGNFKGGPHILSSYENKFASRDNHVSDRQMEEVKQDGGSLDFNMFGRSDYSQSCKFMDDVNNIFSSSMEESKNKEVKSFWNNEVLHAFGSIDTGTDANAGTCTVKGRSSVGFPSVVSRSDQTFPNTNNLPGDMKSVSDSALWEQPKSEGMNKSRNNELTGSVNHSRTHGDIMPEFIRRTSKQNFQPSRLVDTSSAPQQLSGCFPNFNILSEKRTISKFSDEQDAYGDLNERFEGISGFEELGSGSTNQSQYNFPTAQGTLNSNELKGFSHAEIKDGFDSSFWLEKESLTLFPETASGHQTFTICVWCRKEFYHQGVSSVTKSGSIGLVCATCQAKFPGKLALSGTVKRSSLFSVKQFLKTFQNSIWLAKQEET